MPSRRQTQGPVSVEIVPCDPTRYEGSVADMIADMRGAQRMDMTPRDFEGTVWDKYDDAWGQKRMDQQTRKSKALATWR